MSASPDIIPNRIPVVSSPSGNLIISYYQKRCCRNRRPKKAAATQCSSALPVFLSVSCAGARAASPFTERSYSDPHPSCGSELS